MQIPGIRQSIDDSITLTQRANIFVEMINVMGKLHRLSEAQEMVKEARGLFNGTTAEVKVIVADSELQIRRNDFDSDVRMLNQVKFALP